VNAGFLYGTNEIVIYVVFFALMLAATDAGFRLGRKSQGSIPDKTKLQISVVEDAILGVLALLLGFTMFMAVSRFDARKQLVLDEANAIGTSRLRTALLPAPEGPDIASLLRQYIDVRVQYGTSGNDLARLDSLNMQTVRLQNEFWKRATAYGQKDPDPVKAGLLLQSLNQVIDLESARRVAFQNPVPESVIYVNGIVGLLASMLVGYTFGLHGRRQIFSTCVLALAITLVLALIIDLDRPRSGFIRVSQQPMIDLQH
jgi:prepilin signal peptidase PulO-like enzyme (type II secretory pathway)